MDNDYIIEIPQLENCFNEKELEINCKNNEAHYNNDYGATCYKVKKSQPETKHIFNSINSNIMFDELVGWYISKNEGNWLKPHVDVNRNAVLMFPIEPKVYTISFLDNLIDQNTIYEYTYKCPTIINSFIPHCVYDTSPRKFFQISLFIKNFNWDNFRKIVNEGKFINNKI